MVRSTMDVVVIAAAAMPPPHHLSPTNKNSNPYIKVMNKSCAGAARVKLQVNMTLIKLAMARNNIEPGGSIRAEHVIHNSIYVYCMLCVYESQTVQ